MKLTIGFGNSKGLVGVLKRWLLGDEVTHCWLEYDVDGFGQTVVVQAQLTGVELVLMSRVEKKYDVACRYRTTIEVPGGVQTAISYIGAEYDVRGLLIDIVVMWIWRWFGKILKNPLWSPRDVICSELIVRCDPEGVIPPWRELNPEMVSPQMLLDICRRGQWFEETEKP